MLAFSTKQKEEEITIDDVPYLVREFMGKDRDEWMSSMMARAKFGPDGKPIGAGDVRGIQSSLIAKCLFLKEVPAKPVATGIIDGWSASTVEALFKLCQKINGLDEESKAAEKKDS